MIEAAVGGFVTGFVTCVVLESAANDEPDPSEREARRYAEGEITLGELERRLEVLEDPEATFIRGSVERVGGIGEETSWTIAEQYRTVEELRRADVEELQQINNVGEQRAQALKERLS